MFNRWFLNGLLCASLFLAASSGRSQVILFVTASATETNNTVEDVLPLSGANQSIFVATAGGGNAVIGCTALAVDSSIHRIFLLDAPARTIWSMNEDGTGLVSVAAITNSTPTDIALDTVNQQVYFTTSSYNQADNTIQRVNYSGGGGTLLFTASGSSGNGVGRCTALALDLLHSEIFFSDVGSNALWSVGLGSGILNLVENNLTAAPLDLALDVTNQFVYYVTSSAIQSENTVQRVGYNGLTNTLLVTAGSGNSVLRCTALDFDRVASTIYLSDAGASALWSLNADGSGIATVEGELIAVARRLRALPSLQVTVVNLNDTGPGSLREAILDSASGTSITFSNGLFSSQPGVINLVTVGDTTFGPSSFAVTNQISIVGPVGSNGLVLARSNGAPPMRLFYVGPTGALTLKNLTLTNGLADGGSGGSGYQRGGGGGGGAGMGGAIFDWGTLDLENSTLAGNEAIGGAGGGGAGGAGDGSGGGGGGLGGSGGEGGQASIGATGGPPSGGVGGAGNETGGSGVIGGGGGGGGSSMTAGSGSGAGGVGGFGGGGGGGGAYQTVGESGGAGGAGGAGGFGGGGGGPGGGSPGGAIGTAGFGGGASGATADNSGNTGSAGGGGAGFGGAVFSVYGAIAVTNCTFSGNAAVGGQGGSMLGSLGSNGAGWGGGIFLVDSSLDVLNGTFAYNQAGQGGGICNLGYQGSSTVVLRNTIVADSILAASDYFSTNASGFTNTDFGPRNLIQVNNGFGGEIASTADPRLTALQNNGGPTWTHALLNGSPAIDAGDNVDLPATDQRGYPRVVDGDDNGSAIVDLGAVEDGLVLLSAGPQTLEDIVSGGFELTLTGETNRFYAIDYSTNLADWYSVGTVLVPPLGVTTLFDTNAVDRRQEHFYRAAALP